MRGPPGAASAGTRARHFAFCGYGGIRWSQERCCGLLRVVGRSGRPRRGLPSAKSSACRLGERRTAGAAVAGTYPKPIGLLCANDDRAASILETCHAPGYGVPEDVSVIGVDDDQYVCQLQNPPLSSVRMASEQAGYEAAALLDRMIRGDERMSRKHIIAHATGVTVCQSTSVLMVRKADVRKALRFIRENAGRPIRVADIVKATGLSHRTLNDQFQSELGCSINRQLTSARIACISRLLTETKMRIHEIATLVGYEDDRHFSRYFKRATGLTPQAYRRKHSPP